MSISIFSVFIIFIIFIKLLSSKSFESIYIYVFMICIIVETFINTGYFLIVKGTIYKTADFLQVILALLSILVIFERRTINAKHSISFLLLFIVILLNLTILKLSPYEGLVRNFDALDRISLEWYSKPELNVQSFKSALRILLFIYNALILKLIITKDKWENVKREINKFGIFIIIFCWFEFITKNIFNINLKPLTDALFGNVIKNDMLLTRNNLFTIHGLASEPSQLAMILFYFMVFYIISDNAIKDKFWLNMLIWSSVILMFFSGSFRFIGLVPWIIIIYLIKEDVNYKVIGIFIFIVLSTLIAYYFGFLDYFLTRFERVLTFVSKGTISTDSSEAARLNTVIESFKVFLKRPIFGIGLGTTFAYGFIPSILATMGLTGTLVWYYIIFKQIGNIRINTKYFSIVSCFTLCWIYTSAIDVAYLSIVLAYAIEMYFSDNRLRIKNNVNHIVV
ncbi:hypothetical protein [Proteiniclasticum ruminis]|uniref:O-antigen ligase like membrane protein n=1 Tax=Proteiniclasticum ruminis TaxID=398199 RepID=A0A1G8SB78_9CLOT|nr:hypothetical protein [Proteiniclasticum ruminis]SDJ26476.1 hypothetical protein SAMN05421804_11123 [Proteiniclasticum ruminis]